ncbi:MAG: hypothetical protein JRI23_08125 [Deltaproteobacteria bacterium]|jgi:outer membrane murein-binding lipoprotein Lpp|nr:hypothetical protein [Deltaproteobacteria bacterium]MBW2531579.1 hypothetical protein [Deltaproteobacteria bacterium]
MRPNYLSTRRIQSGAAAARHLAIALRERIRTLSADAQRRLNASVTRMLWATMALPVALLIVGCASGKDELTKQVEQLSAEIRELRAAALTAQDRLDALEERGPTGESADGDGGAADGASPKGRPSLDVVRLSPAEENPDGSAAPTMAEGPPEEDDDSRPVVRVTRNGGRVDRLRTGAQSAASGRRPMAKSK